MAVETDVIDDSDVAVTKEQELEARNVPLVIPTTRVLEQDIGVGTVANTRKEHQMVEAVPDPHPVVEIGPEYLPSGWPAAR